MSEAAAILIWGVVIHLVVDWLFQNEWMAVNKANLRHPAGYVHAGLHGAAQLLVFPWEAAVVIGVTHLLIDTRKPVAWWSRLIRQTQPRGWVEPLQRGQIAQATIRPEIMDIGMDVRIWADQVWHIGVIAILALVVS